MNIKEIEKIRKSINILDNIKTNFDKGRDIDYMDDLYEAKGILEELIEFKDFDLR